MTCSLLAIAFWSAFGGMIGMLVGAAICTIFLLLAVGHLTPDYWGD